MEHQIFPTWESRLWSNLSPLYSQEYSANNFNVKQVWTDNGTQNAAVGHKNGDVTKYTFAIPGEELFNWRHNNTRDDRENYNAIAYGFQNADESNSESGDVRRVTFGDLPFALTPRI